MILFNSFFMIKIESNIKISDFCQEQTKIRFVIRLERSGSCRLRQMVTQRVQRKGGFPWLFCWVCHVSTTDFCLALAEWLL
jgi:hypothetical protein